jgi:hypothetical protein
MTTNNKTVTAPALIARLAAAKATRQAQASTKAQGLRAQLEAAVGGLHSLPALEALRQEGRLEMEGEDLSSFEKEIDRLVTLRKEFERAEAEAKRLGQLSTTQALEAYLGRKVENELKEKEAELKAKELADKAKAKAAREEEIANVLAKMAEGKEKPLTEKQEEIIKIFLRGNPKWKFTPTLQGRSALLRASEAAASAFRKDHKIKAVKAAPLTHNMKV